MTSNPVRMNVRGLLHDTIIRAATAHNVPCPTATFTVSTSWHEPEQGWTAQCILLIPIPGVSPLFQCSKVSPSQDGASIHAMTLALAELSDYIPTDGATKTELDPPVGPLDGQFHSNSIPIPNGSIVLILGCVHSGKTERLNQTIRANRIADLSVLSIQYDKDGSGHRADALSSSSGTREPGVLARTLREVDVLTVDSDVIVVDSGHMFKDLAAMCEQWANNGKIVHVAALAGDYQRRMYDQIRLLIPMAESVVYLKAVCSGCKKKAQFSIRLDGGVYEPACRSCFAAHADKVQSDEQ